MIAFLSGTLEYLSGDLAVIDVGGVGYEVNVSAEVSGNLSSIGTGNIVKLYTYMYVREGQVALYGFLSRGDLALFKLLITVSGVGPKGDLQGAGDRKKDCRTPDPGPEGQGFFRLCAGSCRWDRSDRHGGRSAAGCCSGVPGRYACIGGGRSPCCPGIPAGGSFTRC